MNNTLPGRQESCRRIRQISKRENTLDGTALQGLRPLPLVEISSGNLEGLDITVDQPGNGMGFVPIYLPSSVRLSCFRSFVAIRCYIGAPSRRGEEVLLPGEPEFRKAESRALTGSMFDDQS
jgi:hypothetical protein